MEALDLVGLGDDPALEFVNTTAPLPDGGVLELIGEGRAYLSWLRRLGLIDSADRQVVVESCTPAGLDAVAAEARDLREWLRPVIAAWAAAPERTLSAEVVARLNAVLAADQRFTAIETEARGVTVRELRRWDGPAQLLVPPIEAAARLLVAGERRLVRNCEGCTIWFYDHTKAHRRRWCSMALCGNRAKAQGHRQRVAAAKADQP
jgi:predicted RNA-binding Zn ribbon-like protein